VRERERERQGLCVCLCVRERERDRVCVCEREGERERERERQGLCVCLCVRERERESSSVKYTFLSLRPFWLSPAQVMVVPVGGSSETYGQEVRGNTTLWTK